MLADASGNYPNTSIELRTRANTPIDNLQVWQHSRMEWNQLGESLGRYKADRVSDEPCPVYNCHGLTFGSRRTQVCLSILPILKDDGFERIPEKDTRAGDIVVYTTGLGEIIHSGFVIGRRPVLLAHRSEFSIPVIWSKWGKGHEMIHPVGECPYMDTGNEASYYRLRRWSPS